MMIVSWINMIDQTEKSFITLEYKKNHMPYNHLIMNYMAYNIKKINYTSLFDIAHH